MKFSSVIVFALLSTVALAAPFDKRAASAAVQAQNAQDAKDLNAKFATLNANSPCTSGQNACVNGGFAQCVNGKFSVTPCAAGEQCTALPLVNSRGTSITCDTAADRDARIAAAEGNSGGSAPASAASNSSAANTSSGANTSSAADTSSASGNSCMNGNPASNSSAAGTSSTSGASNNSSSTGTSSMSGASNNSSSTGTSSTSGASNNSSSTGTSGGSDISSIRKQNAADAIAQQNSFNSLTPNSPCTNGQNACVNGQFAQCSGGKFSMTPCAGGEQCFALPLVNKKGTSVTCDTQADRDARIAAAQQGQS